MLSTIIIIIVIITNTLLNPCVEIVRLQFLVSLFDVCPHSSEFFYGFRRLSLGCYHSLSLPWSFSSSSSASVTFSSSSSSSGPVCPASLPECSPPEPPPLLDKFRTGLCPFEDPDNRIDRVLQFPKNIFIRSRVQTFPA